MLAEACLLCSRGRQAPKELAGGVARVACHRQYAKHLQVPSESL